MGAVYNEEENEWQTKEWYEECTKRDENEIEPKKEIKVGDKCVVIGGYNSSHYVPIGTIVHVKSVHIDYFDCVGWTVPQFIKESDLVVTE